jgi:hypothetical protein
MLINEFQRLGPKWYLMGTALELISGPGVGKSTVVRDIARALSKDYGTFAIITMILSGLDAPDIRGFLFPFRDENDDFYARFTRPTVFPNKWNVEVFVNGELVLKYDGPVPERGILFFDEFGQAEIDVQKPTGQLLLEGRIGEYYLGDGWARWAASNRMEDRSGVVKPLAFLQNRRKIIEIEPAYPPFEDWAMHNGVHPLIISFAKQHPNLVFRPEIPKEPGPFSTPRSLVLCGNDLMHLRDESHGDMRLPDDASAIEVMSGWLGQGTMPTLLNHLKMANELPTLEDVVANPAKCKLPGTTPARYVMAMMLAHHVNKKNAAAFITYISRIQEKEIQILFAVNTSRRNQDVITTPEFQQWLAENAQLALIAFG